MDYNKEVEKLLDLLGHEHWTKADIALIIEAIANRAINEWIVNQRKGIAR
jgi:hypothetical protein